MTFKKSLVLLQFFFIIYSIIAQPVEWDWSVHGGGVSDDVGYSVTCDNSGNIIVVGHYNETAFFLPYNITSIGIYGGGFIVKYDSIGNALWVKKIICTSVVIIGSVTVDDSDNIYVTGSFKETVYADTITLTSNDHSDFFVGKYDPEGNLLWIKSAGGIGLDAGMSLVCNENLLYVTGVYYDSIYFDSILLTCKGDWDIFNACLDSNGNYQWIIKSGGTGWDFSRAITMNDNSDIFVSGVFMGTSYFGDSVIVSINGSSDGFIAKYSIDGHIQWVRSMGGEASDYCVSAIADNENIYIMGHFEGIAQFGNFTLNCTNDMDYFICKLDLYGNFIWAKQIKTKLYWEDFFNHSLETDGLGNIYLTGRFMDTLYYDDIIIPSNGSYDIFVLKLDENGDCIWSLSAGNDHPSGDYSRSITRSPDGSLYITGRFYDELWFGDNSVTSYGSADIFVAKIHEEPVSVVYDAPAQEIAVYPNPAHGYVNIALPGGDISKAELTDLRGKTVRTWHKPALNRLDVSGIAKNGYIIKIYINNMVYTKKIIIY